MVLQTQMIQRMGRDKCCFVCIFFASITFFGETLLPSFFAPSATCSHIFHESTNTPSYIPGGIGAVSVFDFTVQHRSTAVEQVQGETTYMKDMHLAL